MHGRVRQASTRTGSQSRLLGPESWSILVAGRFLCASEILSSQAPPIELAGQTTCWDCNKFAQVSENCKSASVIMSTGESKRGRENESGRAREREREQTIVAISCRHATGLASLFYLQLASSSGWSACGKRQASSREWKTGEDKRGRIRATERERISLERQRRETRL